MIKENLFKMRLMVGVVLVGNSVLLSIFPFIGVDIQESAEQKYSFILLVEIFLQISFFTVEQMKGKLPNLATFVLQTLFGVCSLIVKIEIITITFAHYKGILCYCFIQLACNCLQLFDANEVIATVFLSKIYIGLKFRYFDDPIYCIFFFQLIFVLFFAKKIQFDQTAQLAANKEYNKSQQNTLKQILTQFSDSFCILLNKKENFKTVFFSQTMGSQFEINDPTQVKDVLQNLNINKSRKNILDIIENQSQQIQKKKSQKSGFVASSEYQFKQNNHQMADTPQIFNVKIIFVDIFKEVYIILLFENPLTKTIQEEDLKIQQLKNEVQHKDHILASVTHDFKTPLNGMIALIEYLETQILLIIYLFRNNLSQEQIQYLQIIKKNSFLILFMVHDISDLARLQNNKFELCYTKFDIEEVTNEVIQLLILQCEQKGIMLSQKSNLVDSIIISDQNRIKQILLNLISNAMKFTTQGSITITLSDHIKSYSLNEEKVIKISVTDTGTGISKEIIKNLFQEYATYNQNGMNRNGVGLGLVICKKIASQLGPYDKIEVESEVEVGSTFSFYVSSKIKSQFRQYVSYKYIEQNSSPQRKSPQSYRTQNQRFSFQQLIVNSNILVRSSVNPMIDNSNLLFSDDFSESMIEDREQQKNQNLFSDQKNTKQNDISCVNIKIVEEQSIPLCKSGEMIKRMSTPPKLFSFPQQIESINRWEHEDICLPKNCAILVVDDEPFNILAVKVIFKSFPWIQFEEAYNGQQAINKLVINSSIILFQKEVKESPISVCAYGPNNANNEWVPSGEVDQETDSKQRNLSFEDHRFDRVQQYGTVIGIKSAEFRCFHIEAFVESRHPGDPETFKCVIILDI